MTEEIRSILMIAAFSISILTSIFTWLTRDTRDTRMKVESLKERVDKITEDIIHFPDKEAMHRLELAIERMEGKLGCMDERLKPISATSQRFQEYMLRGEK